MKKFFVAASIAVVLIVGLVVGTVKSVAVAPVVAVVSVITPLPVVTVAPVATPVARVYRHGDVSWVEPLALAAGWERRQIPRLLHIILRESGGCPDRIGGSVVDKNCKFIRMSTMTHPSDSGLLQINGVHWKKDHAQYAGLICKRMDICTQEPLLDAFTNLKAGRLLFDVAGWSPWYIQPSN